MATLIIIGDKLAAAKTPQEATCYEPQFSAIPGAEKNKRVVNSMFWQHFAKRNGLLQLFYGSNGLMTEGCTAITKADIQFIEAALTRLQINNPGIESDTNKYINSDELDDYHRFMWLLLWMKRMLGNAKCPCIYTELKIGAAATH
jgi:hypothetical protein